METTINFLSIAEVSSVNLALIIAGAVLCLLSYTLRLAAHISIYRRGTSGLRSHLLSIVTFLGYFGWGYWSSTDPVKMNISTSVSVPIGVALAVIGFGLFLYTEIKKHGVGEADQLVTKGIYSKIRHPMYIGLVLFHFGFPFIFRSFVACLSTVLWAGFISVWTSFEEKSLEKRFSQKYIDYKRQTWF